MSPLYKRRKELQEIERQEREGSSFWTENFSSATRNRIHLAMKGSSGGDYFPLLDAAIGFLLADLGVLTLFPRSSGAEDFYRYLAECPDDMVPSVIEAYGEGGRHQFREQALRRAFDASVPFTDEPLPFDEGFANDINRVLAEDRIAFEYVDGQMIPFASRELHVEVVTPTLRLLAHPGWERVETSYQKALTELAQGAGDDAITDVGTALQEALTTLGATGDSLGKLIPDAKKRGLIASHDVALLNAIEKACQWVSADRSNNGDAHHTVNSSVHDAWFTVHVTGAIILRLSANLPRNLEA